jgi:hypothetical protein
MDVHQQRAAYESRLAIARSALAAAEAHVVAMGEEGAASDINSMILAISALMRESLERKTRKPLRGQLTIYMSADAAAAAHQRDGLR